MPNLRQRQWLFIAIAIAIILLLTLIAAPNSSGRKNDSGSTYGRSPDGYGAWYEYVSQKGLPIERWRKPFSRLIEDEVRGTYVQIRSKADFLANLNDLSTPKREWVSQGNTLVIIGSYQPATAAPFSSMIPYRQQTLSDNRIKIETTRRYRQRTKNQTEIILGDRYGAVVWQENIGKGKVIYCTTPYLAANAYQDHLENYEFLAELVSDHRTILVDEYIHGYKDRETIARERQGNILDYLAKTPLFLLFIQAILIAMVASLAALRRFGQPVTQHQAIADNSTAYIDALAGVLQKAQSTDFAMEAIAQDEQRKLQASLGLGKSLVDRQTLIAAWKQHSGSSTELERLLNTSDRKNKLSDLQLINWIRQWQTINDSINSHANSL